MSAVSIDGSFATAGDVVAPIPDAAVALDGSGRVIAANDGALRLFGCSETGLVGHPLAPLLAIARS